MLQKDLISKKEMTNTSKLATHYNFFNQNKLLFLVIVYVHCIPFFIDILEAAPLASRGSIFKWITDNVYS